MFNENLKGKLGTLFGPYHGVLSDEEITELEEENWAGLFYSEIFLNIDETIFSDLYSKNRHSRPNFPVNILVGLLIIKMLLDYSDKELFNNYKFNIMIRFALGVMNFGEFKLNKRTYYNFKKRLLNYEMEHGINLLEKQFKNINLDIIEKYNVSTKEMKADSTHIWSNIKNMSRLELCIVTLRKFITSMQLPVFSDKVESFLVDKAQNYCFKLKHKNVENKLSEVGAILLEYFITYRNDEKISQSEAFSILKRVLHEQFNWETDLKTITPKPAKELVSSNIQSPHDPEATYRKKAGKKYKGYVVNAVETASSGNHLNIITDLKVEPNVKSDGSLLIPSIEEMKELGVQRIYVDGGYDEEQLIKTAQSNSVGLAFTGLKNKKTGKLPLNSFEYDGEETVRCFGGATSIEVKKNDKRILVRFNKKDCGKCEFKEKCPVEIHKKFNSVSIPQHSLRKKQYELSPEEHKKAVSKRASVEATMRQFKLICYKDKFRFRRYANVRLMLIGRAISINFKRVLSFLSPKSRKREGSTGKLLVFSIKIVNFLCKIEFIVNNNDVLRFYVDYE